MRDSSYESRGKESNGNSDLENEVQFAALRDESVGILLMLPSGTEHFRGG